QSGSVWNIYKIDLTQPFDFHFNVFLGCHDADGADGIAFVLQPISTRIGSNGGGLGFLGVTPSVGVTIDTWQNSEQGQMYGDPAYDHIAIQLNGDLDHNSPNNIAGPVTALANSDNIEDCKWHVFRIAWDPLTQTLKSQMDGVDRVQATIDLINKVFSGDPNVFWGFTGSTGGAKNLQRFCTSLNPGFSTASNQTTCYPTPILFTDSSTSFGTIVKWFWDFGDGTIDSVQNPALHNYPAPGNYDVKLTILGNNGCLSDTFSQRLVEGSKPIANFGAAPPPYCQYKSIRFYDSSYVEFGTINEWTWNLNGSTQIYSNSPGLIHGFPPGANQIDLTVQTKEGCISDPITKNILVEPHPDIDMSFEDVCLHNPTNFQAILNSPNPPVQKWYWNLGDGTIDSTATVNHIYAAGGAYPVKLIALGGNGCYSDTISRVANVFHTDAFAGNDTVIAISQPLQLHGTGGDIYQWSPSFGLSNPNIADPIAVLEEDASYVLTVTSIVGCPSSDTIKIKVFKGPEFYVPTAFTPNGDGLNDKFHFVAIGMTEIHYFKVFNRFGQVVYSSTDAKNGWDGTINGKAQPAGTYVWMIEGRDYLGNLVSKKGTVTLIK
ncbi:MAG: hypothetical protein C5B52_09255, partial [Bacteroidetes bacterium]